MQKSPKYVVVIGAARSGTKFVRDLIGSSLDCQAVPYDVNFIWRTSHTEKPHDKLKAWECSAQNAHKIQRKLQSLSRWHQEGKPEYIVEKTVSNSLRVPYIEQALEDVRYVHLIRDGRDVVESSLRQWKAPANPKYLLQKLRTMPLSDIGYAFWYLGNLIRGMRRRDRSVNVWGVRYPGIEQDLETKSLLEVCARQWTSCVDSALNDFQEVPPARRLEIRYEQLISDPTQVDRICDFLNLTDRPKVQQYYLQNLTVGRGSRWEQLSEDPSWQAALELMLPKLETLGYVGAARTWQHAA
ncbi:MAG: sulfotransferase family protein [Bythopirellula sp.]